MQIKVVIITKCKALAVRTLHSMLGVTQVAMTNPSINVEVKFIDDDIRSLRDIIKQYIKSTVRLVFFDYGAAVDREGIKKLMYEFPGGCNAMVTPIVKDGINWDMFKDKIKHDSKEPINQLGLEFDTTLGKKIEDGLWYVDKTTPKIWAMDTKPIYKKIKGDKGLGTNIPLGRKELFEFLKEKGVKICAFTPAKTVTQFQHECISNIINAAGVVVKQHEPETTSK